MSSQRAQYSATQDELEARALKLSAADPGNTTNLGQIYGSLDDWLLELGPYRFILVPFAREWWWCDPAQKAWRCTGYGPGEVRFVYDGEQLKTVPVAAVGAPASAPPPQVTSTSAAPEAAKPSTNRRFCPSCGTPVGAAWKFCQSCGEKLPQGASVT